jgi:uncharacterized protein
MSLMSRLIAKVSKLLPAETYDVVLENDLKVRMSDGVELLANRYYPRAGGNRPTLLLRTPYGRQNFDPIARLFAELSIRSSDPKCVVSHKR